MLGITFLRRTRTNRADEPARAMRERLRISFEQLEWRGASDESYLHLAEVQRRAEISGREFEKVRKRTLLRCLAEAMNAAPSSRDDEQRLLALVSFLGFSDDELRSKTYWRAWRAVVIAGANEGRRPLLTAEAPALIVKPGEVVHLAVPGELLRAADSTSTGQSPEVDDEGLLTVTSQRLIFVGERRSLEFLYARLIDLTATADGLRLAVSNRQSPSLLRTADDELLAAVVNGAARSATR